MLLGLPLDDMTVLIADDDEDMRLYLKGCLHGLGARRVIETADGENALRVARAEAIDLVVSDLRMPHLNGIDLCIALKARVRTRDVPVLLISGESDGLPADAPADGFLSKPFNAAGLRSVIELLLAQPP
jgi:CheY-like chemotaxis protein